MPSEDSTPFMRIIFLGTPAFAIPSLEKLLAWPKGKVVAVVTQPDRPAGRGNKLQPPPTKVLAESHGIAVMQPQRLSKSPETVAAMQELKPDVLVTAAFGQILKKDVLEMAPYGVVNVHGSLLPKYRGAAPINWAIINGEKETGVTTMLSDAGIDTGKMLLTKTIPITADMNAEQLAEVMSVVGANLLIETLEGLLSKSITPKDQDNSQATLARMLKKDDGQIDWSKPAAAIHNQVRGLTPWPGCSTMFNGESLKICKTAIPASDSYAQLDPSATTLPGTVTKSTKPLLIACGVNGKEMLELQVVQPANRSKMDASSWANGVRLQAGTALGS